MRVKHGHPVSAYHSENCVRSTAAFIHFRRSDVAILFSLLQEIHDRLRVIHDLFCHAANVNITIFSFVQWQSCIFCTEQVIDIFIIDLKDNREQGKRQKSNRTSI